MVQVVIFDDNGNALDSVDVRVGEGEVLRILKILNSDNHPIGVTLKVGGKPHRINVHPDNIARLHQETADVQSGSGLIDTISKLSKLIHNNVPAIADTGKGLYRGYKTLKNGGSSTPLTHAVGRAIDLGRNMYGQYKQSGGALDSDALSGALHSLDLSLADRGDSRLKKKSKRMDMTAAEKHQAYRHNEDRRLIVKYLYSHEAGALLQNKAAKSSTVGKSKLTARDKVIIRDNVTQRTRQIRESTDPELYNRLLSEAKTWYADPKQKIYGFRPPNAFILYVTHNKLAGEKQKDAVERLSKVWSSMSDSDKDRVQRQYAGEISRYVTHM